MQQLTTLYSMCCTMLLLAIFALETFTKYRRGPGDMEGGRRGA